MLLGMFTIFTTQARAPTQPILRDLTKLMFRITCSDDFESMCKTAYGLKYISMHLSLFHPLSFCQTIQFSWTT